MKHLNVDVHGMRLEKVKEYIDNLFSFAPGDVEDICVIHGFNNGTILRDFIRSSVTNARLDEVQIYEDGRTILKLTH